jgi:cob(I)alamin adenosyltransferase
MKFYSRKGDDGRTKTLKKANIAKSDPLIGLLGSLDEACAFLSLASLHLNNALLRGLILQIEKDMHSLMAEAAGGSEATRPSQRVVWLEKEIENWGNNLLMPSDFVLFWSNSSSALLNVARTVVRRAEREAVTLTENQSLFNPQWLGYLNRLSSLIYILQLLLENPPKEG